MLSRLLLFLSASVYLCNGESMMPPPPQALVPRDATTDCQNLTEGLNASCWDLVPPKIGMPAFLNTWNKKTNTCQEGEMWANCFMRLAGLPSSVSRPIRCDLIGPYVCPTPTLELFEKITAPIGYGVASIWGRQRNQGPQCEFSGKLTAFTALQQYMTSLYQALETDKGSLIVKNGFLNQTTGPRIVMPILIDILNVITDPIAGNLTMLLQPKTPQIIGQGSWIIPTEDQAPLIVGQTIGYLLQWMMKEWRGGGFTALNAEGNLIEILVDDGW